MSVGLLRKGFVLASLFCMGVAAEPAPATRIYTYTGMATIIDVFNLPRVSARWTARYGYASNGSMLWASLRVGDARRWLQICPVDFNPDFSCQPLAFDGTTLRSAHRFTIEDGADVEIASANGFNGLDLATVRHADYAVLPADASFAVVGFSAVTSDGFGYWVGEGPVESVSVAVPEPGTWALMLGGFLVLGAALRVRQARIGAQSESRSDRIRTAALSP